MIQLFIAAVYAVAVFLAAYHTGNWALATYDRGRDIVGPE